MRLGLVIAALSLPLVLATAAHAERHYDCTKAGNANKAACKAVPVATTAAMPTAPSAQPTAAATKSERHYDCTKPANANKAACKNAPAATPAPKAAPVATVKPSPAPAVAPARSPPPTATPTATRQPAPRPSDATLSSSAGATGQCKDGTFTHSKTHSGACSHHGGVAKWL